MLFFGLWLLFGAVMIIWWIYKWARRMLGFDYVENFDGKKWAMKNMNERDFTSYILRKEAKKKDE